MYIFLKHGNINKKIRPADFCADRIDVITNFAVITNVVIKSVHSNSYTMVCPPVQEDNPRALASGLSPVQADKPWYNYFMPPPSMSSLSV